MRILSSVFILLLVVASCTKPAHTPKPKGYNRIQLLEASYQTYTTPYFTFMQSQQAVVEQVQTDKKTDFWFNISYPAYGAIVYCSYLPISKQTFNKALEDSYHLAYSHGLKADNINQTIYSNPEHRTSGIIYDIEGSVATPVQFFITDSLSHFVRGSVYYNTQVNNDSVAPITERLRADIVQMMESLEWKK